MDLLSIFGHLWIPYLSNSTKITTNTETAMLSTNRELVVHFWPLVDSVNRCKLRLDCQNWRCTCLKTTTKQTFVLQKKPPIFNKKNAISPLQQNTICSHICSLWNIPLLRCKPCQKWFSFLGNLTGKYDAIQQGEIDNGELRKYGKLNPGEI